MSRWLKGVLRNATKGPPSQPRDTHPQSRTAFGTEIHAVVFEAATTFADLRRLQILEYLVAHQRASGEELGATLKMSEYAVCRQTAKLRRRGMITGRREGKRELMFQLTARPKSAVHGGMLAIVRTTLHKR
jgi:DNA-binding transcriptional ArsR family regulator